MNWYPVLAQFRWKGEAIFELSRLDPDYPSTMSGGIIDGNAWHVPFVLMLMIFHEQKTVSSGIFDDLKRFRTAIDMAFYCHIGCFGPSIFRLIVREPFCFFYTEYVTSGNVVTGMVAFFGIECFT